MRTPKAMRLVMTATSADGRLLEQLRAGALRRPCSAWIYSPVRTGTKPAMTKPSPERRLPVQLCGRRMR